MPMRLANGLVKARITETAETLFAEVGFDAVSFRDITNRAGVAVSAIQYHFGSKHAILSEIFARHSKRLTDQRLALLEGVPRDANGRPVLDALLDAFLRPSFLPLNGESNEFFNRLRARLSNESSSVMRDILRDAFDANDHAFLSALMAALPSLSPATIHWRFHMMVGAMIYTMADPGQLAELSDNLCRSSDHETALRQIAATFAAAFRAPEVMA